MKAAGVILNIFLLFLRPLYADQMSTIQHESYMLPCEDNIVSPTHGMRAETIYMARCMEELHYNHRDLSMLDNKEVLIDYMGELDWHKMFFLQKEVDDFVNRFSPTLDIFVSGGSLMPAFVIFDSYRKCAYARLDWIEKRLNGDWDFSADETYAPDRRKAQWPTSEFEADLLWERRLKYELLNEMMGTEYKLSKEKEDKQDIKVQTDADRDAEALMAAKETISRRYKNLRMDLKDFDSWLVEEIFLNSISHMYDPHSSFLSKSSLDDFNVLLRHFLVGIGATLMDDNGTCVIKELVPGGPASLSKRLKVGDKILAVAQGEDGEFVDIVGMRLYKSVKMIRGEKDTIVRLKIQPIDASPGSYKIVSLVRDEVHLNETRASGEVFSFLDAEKPIKIGVIVLPVFYGDDPNNPEKNANTTSDMKFLINAMKEREISGLIIDLRQNSGGFLEQAITASGLFIVKGPVVQVRDSFGTIENLCDEDSSIDWSGPLIALISSNSASAAEILAGALHDHHRAILVGDPTTHGKGSVQVILPMDQYFNPLHGKDELGAARITIQKWYLPTGGSTQLKGVNADITLPSFEAYLPGKESDLPHALKWDSISAAKFDYEAAAKHNNYYVEKSLIDFLKARADERIETLPEFALLNERIEHFKQNLDEKEISLNLEERRRKSIADLEFKSEVKERLEQLIAADDYKYEKITLGPKADEKPEVFDPQKEDNLPEFDVQLRETLRIMRDWIEKNRQSSEKTIEQNNVPIFIN